MTNPMTPKELRERIEQLPPISGNHKWDEHRRNIRNHFKKDKISEFLKWSTIQATMYVGVNNATMKEYEQFLPQISKWEKAITAPNFGGNEFFPGTQFCPNYVHQAYVLREIEEYFEMNISTLDSIIEFGGGYGAMCAVASNHGFDGDYYLYDLSEISLLQEYYLSNIDIVAYFHDLPMITDGDLMIALYSLSEMPLDDREDFLDIYQTKYYFIKFQEKFFDIDNIEFFSNWASDNLKSWEIVDSKSGKTHKHLVGER